MENLHQAEYLTKQKGQKATSTSPTAALCERFCYPSAIAEHLKELIQILRPQRADSIIILGSTSRGELSTRLEGKTFKIFSDYEFLVVGNYPAQLQEQIRKEIELWENYLPEKSPLFHVDVAFITQRELPRLPKCWRHFETRETGYVLYGQDLRRLIPKIDLNNLDYCELNQILLWRNWHLVMHMPKEMLKSEKVDYPLYAYLLARNGLDIATWILPYEGFMIAGFSKRTEFITKNYVHLPLVQRLGKSFVDNLKRWLHIKLGMIHPSDAISELSEIIETLERARQLLNTLCERSLTSDGYPPKAFGDYRLRAIAKAILLFKQNSSLLNFKWIFLPKLALFANGLLELLKGAKNIIVNKSPDANLSKATQIINELLPKAEITCLKDNRILWTELRKKYLEFGLLYFPFLKQKASYWRKIIEG